MCTLYNFVGDLRQVASDFCQYSGFSHLIKLTTTIKPKYYWTWHNYSNHNAWGPSWSWSYGSWIYYLRNQCLSPLMLWLRISIMARCTTLCDKVCLWLSTGQWFSPGPLVSSNNKTDRHYITEILLKVALNTIKPNQTIIHRGEIFHEIFRFVLSCHFLFFLFWTVNI